MIKILIADEHIIVREMLRQILSDSDDMEVVDEAGNGEEMLKQLYQYGNKKFNEEYGESTDMNNYEELIRYGKEWADEMAKLPAYNKLQWHAIQAAVKLGNLKVWEALDHLYEINKALDAGDEEYSRQATEYELDEEGNLYR